MPASYRELVNKYLPRPIQSEADYRRVLRQLDELMTPRPGRARGQLIELLATLVEQYESREHPPPEISPEKMLAHCLAAKETTPARLDRDTGIPLTTISNVLAGRRGISKLNARRLGAYFHLPTSAFIAG